MFTEIRVRDIWDLISVLRTDSSFSLRRPQVKPKLDIKMVKDGITEGTHSETVDVVPKIYCLWKMEFSYGKYIP